MLLKKKRFSKCGSYVLHFPQSHLQSQIFQISSALVGNKLRNKLVFNKIQISRKLFNVLNIRDDDEVEEEKQPHNSTQHKTTTQSDRDNTEEDSLQWKNGYK